VGSSRHKASTPEVAVVVEELATDERFRLQEQASVWLALDMIDQGAADFADALISAIGTQAGCRYTASFDRGAIKLTGMRTPG
jgi:predicted nucleic-acid-binding protein